MTVSIHGAGDLCRQQHPYMLIPHLILPIQIAAAPLDIIRVMKRLKIHPILSILHLSTKGVRSSNQRVQSRVASGATHGEDHNIVCLQVDTCPTLANQWLNTPRIIHIIRSHMEMHLCIH